MIALLALGLALAHFRNHGPNRIFKIALGATLLLTAGLVFTAMRTVVVAFVIGASVIAWRSLRGALKLGFVFVLFLVLAFAAVVVWQTRDRNALLLGDPSSSLRVQVARSSEALLVNVLDYPHQEPEHHRHLSVAVVVVHK